MLIDCQSCPVRDRRCGDCIVPMMLDARPGLPLDDRERRAVDVFVSAGLIADQEAVQLRAVSEPWVASVAAG